MLKLLKNSTNLLENEKISLAKNWSMKKRILLKILRRLKIMGWHKQTLQTVAQNILPNYIRKMETRTESLKVTYQQQN